MSYTVQFIANIENCDLGTFDDYLEYVNLIINEVETIQITDSTTFNLTVTLDGVESGSYNSTTKTWEVESEPCPPTEIDITFDSIPLGTATTSPYNIDCDTLIQVIIVSNADYPALNGNYVYSGIYQTVNEYTHDTLPNTFIRRVAGEWRVFNTINTIYQNDPSVYEYPYEATYDECTLVQGTIEDYCSEPCADATYTIKDRDETTLYSGSIASGGDLQQYIENTTIEVNDTSFADVVAQGHLNIQVVNSENTQKGSKVGNDWLLPDTTYNIYLDGVFDQSVSLPTLGNDNLTITLVTP